MIKYPTNKNTVSYVRKFHPDQLDTLSDIRHRHLKSNSKLQRENTSPLPIFNRSLSQATVHKNNMPTISLEKSKVKKQAFNKLSNQLQSIQESINNLNQRRQKKLPRYKQKVVTEISDSQPKSKIYQEIISQIKQMKTKIKAKHKQTIQPSISLKESMHVHQNEGDQKTLFYGVDYIDNIKFKIKIKLSKRVYVLMAKNQNMKLLLEMNSAEYMKIHGNQLKANPCNIFKYLTIQNNKIKLNLIKDKKRSKSFKTYLGYY